MKLLKKLTGLIVVAMIVMAIVAAISGSIAFPVIMGICLFFHFVKTKWARWGRFLFPGMMLFASIQQVVRTGFGLVPCIMLGIMAVYLIHVYTTWNEIGLA